MAQSNSSLVAMTSAAAKATIDRAMVRNSVAHSSTKPIPINSHAPRRS